MRVTTDTETGPVGTLLEQPPERDHSQIEWTSSWGQVKIDGNSQTYVDQGNDLRQNSGSNREFDSGRGVTGIKRGSTYEYYIRDSSGAILGRQVGSSVTYMGSEPNGNVLWMVNTSGSRVGSYKYAPYGATSASGSAATLNPFRWIGAQQDTKAGGGAGHYKLGARYYDTESHFTQPDPLVGGLTDPRTVTGYNYAGGDPINQNDLSGYAFEGNCGFAAGVAATAGAVTGGLIGLGAGGVGAAVGAPAGAAVVGGFVKGACESNSGTAGGRAYAGLRGIGPYAVQELPGLIGAGVIAAAGATSGGASS
jgi:RHS repeat-associated protein